MDGRKGGNAFGWKQSYYQIHCGYMWSLCGHKLKRGEEMQEKRSKGFIPDPSFTPNITFINFHRCICVISINFFWMYKCWMATD